MGDEDRNAETCSPSKKWREMNAWWEYISHEIDGSKEIDANFNLPKIKLISHCVQQIRRYRALQLCSAEWHEQAHKTHLKDSWNTSKYNLN